jgi:putative peptidoglycan lipid II flippase
VRGE